jgi:HK97 family phage portal protein
MAIFDFLRELVSKKQSTPEKWLESSVRVVTAGQHGAQKPSFNHQRAVDSCRSWVFAAANINAQAVASVPIRLYAKKGNGRKLYKTRSVPRHQKQYLLGDGHGDARPSNGVLRKIADFGEDMEEVTESHPIIELLSSTNPFLNGFDMTVLRILYGELTGNAYLHPVIDEDSGLPAELWPLAPQFTEVIPDEDEFISGYLYGISADRKQVFERDEVIHFRRPNPGNLYYGLGKIEAAYGAVLSNQAVHDMDLAMFQNSARPDYAVVVRGTPTSDQLDRFQEQVEQRLRGTRRDGNFIAVTGDVQFTPLNFPPKDVAGREDIVEEIAAVFGVPVSMLKANDPNLASARTGFAQWREGTVLPLLRMDEEELNQTLLPMFGLEDELCLAYDNPVPRDTQYELQERQTAVQGGWRTINEARLEEGREPFEDNEFADQPLINGQPLGASAQQPPGPGGGMPGMDLSSLFSEDGQPEEEGDSPDAEAAAKFLKSVRDGTLQGYSAIKLLQGCGFSRQVAEKMVDAESKANNIERTEDDLYDTKEQAAAVASLIGCRGVRSIDADGETKYCPCADEKDFNTLTGKCPEGECDGDHGGQPRPKAFRLRHILDGAATQELTKSFGDWSVRFKATSDNCGTGAGGFKEDNTCATGSSATESGRTLESRKEQIDQHLENSTRYDPNGFLTDEIAVLPEEEKVKALVYAAGELNRMSRGFPQVFETDHITQGNEIVAIPGAANEEVLAKTGDGYVYGALAQEAQKRAAEFLGHEDDNPLGHLTKESQNLIQAVARKSIDEEAVAEMGLNVELAVTRESYRLAALMRPVSESAYNDISDVLSISEMDLPEPDSFSYDTLGDEVGKINIGPRDIFFGGSEEAIEEWDTFDDRTRQDIFQTYELAKKYYKQFPIGDVGDIKPIERYRVAQNMSFAVEKHFAEKGVSVRVDPLMFMSSQFLVNPELRDPGADNLRGYVSQQIGRYQSAFMEVVALNRSINELNAAGYDTDLLEFQMIQRGQGVSTVKLHSQDDRTVAYFNPTNQRTTLPVDVGEYSPLYRTPQEGWMASEEGGPAYVVTHEVGHALHRRSLERTHKKLYGRGGSTYTSQDSGRLAGAKIWEQAGGDMSKLTPAYAEGLSNILWYDTDYDNYSQKQTGAKNLVSRFVSNYASTEPAEFIAEAFAMKVTAPKKWDSIKNETVVVTSNRMLFETLNSTIPDNELGFYTDMPDSQKNKAIGFTVEDLYTMMGGE